MDLNTTVRKLLQGKRQTPLARKFAKSNARRNKAKLDPAVTARILAVRPILEVSK